MLDHQPQYVKKSQPDPRSRYESFHQATLTSTRAAYAHLGADAAEYIAAMIEFLRYEFPVDRFTREEAHFYQDKCKFLDYCLALPENERSQQALMAIEAVVKQMFPQENEEQSRPYVGSFYFLFNHAISNYLVENILAGSKQACPQIAILE